MQHFITSLTSLFMTRQNSIFGRGCLENGSRTEQKSMFSSMSTLCAKNLDSPGSVLQYLHRVLRGHCTRRRLDGYIGMGSMDAEHSCLGC
jgi:hypothetical protein